MKTAIFFYSTYGHMHKMAQAAAEGAERAGAEVKLLRIPEVIPEETLKQIGAYEAQQAFADVPVATVDDLRWPDAAVFGVPTRYGNMPGQFRTSSTRPGRSGPTGQRSARSPRSCRVPGHSTAGRRQRSSRPRSRSCIWAT